MSQLPVVKRDYEKEKTSSGADLYKTTRDSATSLVKSLDNLFRNLKRLTPAVAECTICFNTQKPHDVVRTVLRKHRNYLVANENLAFFVRM